MSAQQRLAKMARSGAGTAYGQVIEYIQGASQHNNTTPRPTFDAHLVSRSPLPGLLHQPTERRHAIQVPGTLVPVTLEALGQGAVWPYCRDQTRQPARLLHY